MDDMIDDSRETGRIHRSETGNSVDIAHIGIRAVGIAVGQIGEVPTISPQQAVDIGVARQVHDWHSEPSALWSCLYRGRTICPEAPSAVVHPTVKAAPWSLRPQSPQASLSENSVASFIFWTTEIDESCEELSPRPI